MILGFFDSFDSKKRIVHPRFQRGESFRMVVDLLAYLFDIDIGFLCHRAEIIKSVENLLIALRIRFGSGKDGQADGDKRDDDGKQAEDFTPADRIQLHHGITFLLGKLPPLILSRLGGVAVSLGSVDRIRSSRIVRKLTEREGIGGVGGHMPHTDTVLCDVDQGV